MSSIAWINIFLIVILLLFITFLVILPGKWGKWGKWNQINLESFINTTSQSERQSSITDIFADPEDATNHAKIFYDSLNKTNQDIRKGTVKYYKVDDPIITPVQRNLLRDAFTYSLTTFPLPIKRQVKVCITSDSTEGGMPHTHAEYIYLQHKYLRDGDLNRLKEILTHELCHVHQREEFSMWSNLYTKLGFSRVPEHIQIFQGIDDRIIQNPDTWEAGHWEFKGQIGIMLLKKGGKTLADHEYTVIPVKKGANIEKNEFKKMFGAITQQIDHPNEISAAAVERLLYNSTSGNLEVDKVVRCWIENCKRE
jgi:hypothetical protein